MFDREREIIKEKAWSGGEGLDWEKLRKRRKHIFVTSDQAKSLFSGICLCCNKTHEN